LLLVTWAAFGFTQARFNRVFAPQEGLSPSIERPFRNEVCLNGSWQFQPVPAGDLAAPLLEPDEAKWEKTPVRIPSPWNANAFPVESREGGDFRCFPSYPASWEKAESGWLRRSFDVPAAWFDKRVLLHFNAVAGEAVVYVNGHEVGRHFDIFLPFECDATAFVHPGVNELRVAVRKSSLFDKQGKFGRRTYQGGSMWGQAIVGIWQDVFLEVVPRVHVTDVFVRPDVDKARLSADVTIRNDGDVPANVRLRADVLPWVNHAGKDKLHAPEPNWTLGNRVALDFDSPSATVPPHSARSITLSAPVGAQLQTWSPADPRLYGLVISTNGDKKYARFGWRQVKLVGDKVQLNGKPLIMRGDSWHFTGIPQMTRRYAWAWFTALHDAGLNAVRLHAEPYPSFFLDMADEMGILVLDETAVWASDGGPKLDDPAFWADTKQHLKGLIERDRNHPCVFGWSVSNEVMAVVRNVFHAPKVIEDKASSMNGEWLAVCRANDPTREWVSADGEEDGQGQLPIYMIHYGDRGTMRHAKSTGKPWGVGEAGPAYYGTPKQIAEMAKFEDAYLSVGVRMDGVADISYRSLVDQDEEGGSYRSVFNLVWYGLKPLPLGLPDVHRPPTLRDGVSFPAFHEGQPGVQPERLGPYCSTLNPGYDPRLPLYETWPLFNAIKAAAFEPVKIYNPYGNIDFRAYDASVTGRTIVTPSAPPMPNFHSVHLLAGNAGKVAGMLERLGVRLSDTSLFVVVDGANPPPLSAKPIIESAQSVLVWGAKPETLAELNALLPKRLELTARTASFLAIAGAYPSNVEELEALHLGPTEQTKLLSAGPPKGPRLTDRLKPADLYFSESSPSTILSAGLAGPLLEGADVSLKASDTDWRKWNGQAEMVKTAMVLRSELETKPSGIALATVKTARGTIVLSNLPVDMPNPQAEKLNRIIFENLGIAVDGARNAKMSLAEDGTIGEVMELGPFEVASPEDAITKRLNATSFAAGDASNGQTWHPQIHYSDGTGMRYRYVSFWIASPLALDNLLLDPHLPRLDLDISGKPTVQAWVNGQPVSAIPDNTQLAVPLRTIRRGWNHILLKIIQTPDARVGLRLTASRPEFLKEISVSIAPP